MIPILAAFIILFGLAFFEAPVLIWSIAFFVLLIVFQSIYVIPAFILFLSWSALITFVLFFNFPKIRRKTIIAFLYQKLKKKLPTMSETERLAIEAGDVWWEGELFRGRPNWSLMLNIPKPELSSVELSFLENQVETLCKMIDDWKVSHHDLDLSKPVWNYLKDEGFFGMIIPKEYGGLGFSALGHSTVVQKIATHSLTCAITTMVPNSLGPAELLLHYGTEDQKKKYLPRLAKGLEIPCFALTGPRAGSDASAMPDTGIICKGVFEGKEIIGMKITWDKRYITLAPVATLLGLAVKAYDPDKLLGGKTSLGITVLLIPTNTKGVEIGKRHFPMNQAFMNGPTRGQDIFVPLDWVIGGSSKIGQGWAMLMECLSAGRGISLPALSTAGAKMACKNTSAYAVIRRQFSTSIGQFEGIRVVLGRMAGISYIIEAVRLFTISGIMMGKRPAIATAITKYHLTEMGRYVAIDTMDILAGRGIMFGPKNSLGRWYESIPISITVEGANILTRNLIIFGQGAIRCHGYLQNELEGLYRDNQREGLKQFEKAVSAHLHYTVANFARNLFHALTFGVFLSTPKGVQYKSYYRHLTRMSLALSFIADVSLFFLGGALKRKENLSSRLGDVLSYLYLGSAILKYKKDFGNQNEDDIFVKWCMQFCLFKIQDSFFDFFANFPNRVISFFLRVLTFPFGRLYTLPDDKLTLTLATLISKPSEFRDRLTQHCFIGSPDSNANAQLEDAFLKWHELEPIVTKLEKDLHKSGLPKNATLTEKAEFAVKKGLLTKFDANNVIMLDKATWEAIQVDEFTQEELILGK